jgi:hypothetical protein
MKLPFSINFFAAIFLSIIFVNQSASQPPKVTLERTYIFNSEMQILEIDPRTDSAEIFEKIKSTIQTGLMDEKTSTTVFVQLFIYADKKREFDVSIDSTLNKDVVQLFREIDKIEIPIKNNFDFKYELLFRVN